MLAHLQTLPARLMNGVGNLVLLGLAGGVIAGSVAVNALMLDKYVGGSPEARRIECLVGITHPDCPRYRAEIEKLEGDLSAMRGAREALERQLAGLRAVERAVDTVTLFETFTDPTSGREITVGTVYRKIVEATPKPEHFYCYLALGHGEAGEARNLHFYSSERDAWMSGTEAQKAGVSEATLAYARSVCRPLLIGEGA